MTAFPSQKVTASNRAVSGSEPWSNPWKALLPTAPFVLAQDAPYVQVFNERVSEGSPHWIHTHRLPEPRQGPADAPVIVLQLNPSYDQVPQDIEKGLAALGDEQSVHAGISAQHHWWTRNFGKLLKHVDKERLATRVCSIEYFPYASANFGHGHLRLPSQQYTFDLVRRALDRKAIILVSRGLKYWLGAIPELYLHLYKGSRVGTSLAPTSDDDAIRVFQTINPRSASISNGNLRQDVYSRVARALES